MRLTRPFINGENFGRLTARCVTGRISGYWMVNCLCSCGKAVEVRYLNLRNGNTKSCGCLGLETKRMNRRTHGKSGTTEYSEWCQMKDRCHSPGHRGYWKYGGRGIAVCDAWRADFSRFLRDMGPRPSLKHSLDRIDNSRGYEPGNVRWATATQQMRNTSRNRKIEIRGEVKTLADWAEVAGLPYKTVRWRFDNWSDPERVLFAPLRKVTRASR